MVNGFFNELYNNNNHDSLEEQTTNEMCELYMHVV